jgi:hypothetical protein
MASVRLKEMATNAINMVMLLIVSLKILANLIFNGSVFPRMSKAAIIIKMLKSNLKPTRKAYKI